MANSYVYLPQLVNSIVLLIVKLIPAFGYGFGRVFVVYQKSIGLHVPSVLTDYRGGNHGHCFEAKQCLIRRYKSFDCCIW